MVGILATQKVGIVDGILVGGVAAVGKNVGALGETRVSWCVKEGGRRTEVPEGLEIRRRRYRRSGGWPWKRLRGQSCLRLEARGQREVGYKI